MSYCWILELWMVVIFFSLCKSSISTIMNRHYPYNVKTNKQARDAIDTICGQSSGRPYLVTIVNGGDDLPEEVSGLPLAEASPLTDEIIQLPFAGVFHDDHNLIFVLKHCGGRAIYKHPINPTISFKQRCHWVRGGANSYREGHKWGCSTSRGVGRVFQPSGRYHHYCYWTNYFIWTSYQDLLSSSDPKLVMILSSVCLKPSRLSISLKIKPKVANVAHQVLYDPVDP